MSSGKGPEHDEVAAVTRALLRTERTFRTYAPEDPIRQRTLVALEPRLGALLPLDLEVHPDQLIWESQPLLDPSEPSDLPARLHRDGIRRLILGEELGLDEMTRFMAALATRLHPEDPHRDYVTLLWDATLPNVRVVWIDPYLDLDVPDEVIDGDWQASPAEAVRAPRAPAVPAPPEDAFRVDDEDEKYVATEISKIESTPPWESFIDALLENLQRPQRRERVEQIVLLLDESFKRLLIEERFDHAARVLTGIRATFPVPAQFPVLQALERIAHPDRLGLIVSALERGTCTEDQAEALLLGFGDWAAESLCALLAQAHGEHLRRFYVDTLVKSGPGALEPAMLHLLHAEPTTRKYFARVLGRIKDDAARDALISCLDSGDGMLRAEAVSGLTVHMDDTIRARLWDIALADREGNVRVAALKSVIEDRAGVDCARIVDRLEAADLKVLGEEEKDLLFKALGAGGGERALEYLSASLRGRWMPGRSELEGWRRTTMALVSMGTQAALDVLHTHAKGRGKLATICQDALRHASMGAP